MYVFPGIGLGAILCKAKTITDSMIYAAAIGLSTALTSSEMDAGMLYPAISRIREVSVTVARTVIREAQRQSVDCESNLRSIKDAELDEWIRDRMYDPWSVVEGRVMSRL